MPLSDAARSPRAQRQSARRRAGHRRQPRDQAGMADRWSASAPIWAARPTVASKAITAAGSATATARNTTPPAASAKDRRRRTWRCRLTPSCPPPASRSAEERTACPAHRPTIPKTGFTRWLDHAPADPAARARHDDDVPDAAEPELLVHLRRHPHLLPGRPDRHRHRAGDALRAQRRRWPSTASKTSCAT